MRFEIDKTFTFDTGHRVWAQKLDRSDLCVSTETACKRMHGHTYTIKVCVGSDTLDQSCMVTDFKNLNFVKKFLDEVLDHRFIIDIHDPLFKTITSLDPPIECVNWTLMKDVIYVSDANLSAYIDSFVLVDFCPTSEKICENLYYYIQQRLDGFAIVTAIELWETPKSHCKFSP